MAFVQRHCGLMLVVVAVACLELYQAQSSVGRCRCLKAQQVRGKIVDFQVIERWANCDKTELIVTKLNFDNSTQMVCMYTEGVRAKRFLSCWESINKDRSRKMECIDRPKMAGNGTAEQ